MTDTTDTTTNRQSAALTAALAALDTAAQTADDYDDGEDYSLFAGAAHQLREAFNLDGVTVATTTIADNLHRATDGCAHDPRNDRALMSAEWDLTSATLPATIQTIGERYNILARQTRNVLDRCVTEFKVARKLGTFWYPASQVQRWIDSAEYIDTTITDGD